jgi:AraC-like DNA-binding protein
MKKIFNPQLPALSDIDQIQTLVEHRQVYNLNHCELNIFETRQTTEKVKLLFSSLTFTAMLRGKKVMHLFGNNKFDYFPGESVIVPENEAMIIDFPEASLDHPTQCIALAIDAQKIKETVDLLNQNFAKAENKDEWKIDLNHFHLKNSFELTNSINHLLNISQENNHAKDIFANLALQELLIRLMQTQARTLIFENYLKYVNSHRFAYVIQYIQEHLTENLTIEKLSDLACMSKPNFFKSFKREFGMAPMEYIIQEKIKLAKKYLNQPQISITDACFRTGFNSLNYFCTLFKRIEGVSPNQYKKTISEKRF